MSADGDTTKTVKNEMRNGMTTQELKRILDSHKKWLDGNGGSRAELKGADLRHLDLQHVDLRRADLRQVNLSGAKLYGADLRHANLCHANLKDADLDAVELYRADLEGANLEGASIDYASWPLWCGSIGAKIDKRLAAQLLYHAMRAMQSCADDPDVAAVLESGACIKLANQFHRAGECGRIEEGGAE